MSAQNIAILDLGSNSFHMLIVRVDGHKMEPLFATREPVHLSWEQNEDGTFSKAGLARAKACLLRFHEDLQKYHYHKLRMVGTQAFRVAPDDEPLFAVIENIFGQPLEVISGADEARCIFLAISRLTGLEHGVIIDIGGGSTELVLVEGGEMVANESLALGCGAMTARFFSEGLYFAQAQAYAAGVLKQYPAFFQPGMVVGVSGTIKSAADVCETPLSLTRDQCQQLIEKTKQGTLEGLSEARARVFPGGLAILMALFETLAFEEMRVARIGLREGLALDTFAR